MHSLAIPPARFRYEANWIIYSDDDIVVVNKPSGLLSVPGRGEDKYECIGFHLEPVFGELKVVHRLDMDTSGIMVLARNAQAHRHLSRQFQDRQTQKRYHAVCAGIPALKSGKIQLPMRCDWENRPLQMIDFIYGKHACTLWQLVQQANDRCLIELTPITGRSHQLRLHMKMLGHPILGDNLYADPTSLAKSPRLMLHASELSITHPTRERLQTFYCPAEFMLTLSA